MTATIKEIDTEGLTRCVYDLRRALVGTGQDGDLHTLIRTEAGQWAWEISEQLGPRTRSGANAAIDKDVRRQLTVIPRYSNLTPEQQFSRYSDFTWLAAGPNFLLGINDEDNQKSASADQALQFYRAGQKSGSRGNAFVELGTRNAKNGKHQHLLRLNRVRVSTAGYNAVRNYIKASVGQLKASFARTAGDLVPSKRIPAWVKAQFNAVVTNGKSILDKSALRHPTAPSITFGSRAKGVQSNPVVVNAIASATEKRKYILVDKLKKVISGYVYDWETGKTFRKQL